MKTTKTFGPKSVEHGKPSKPRFRRRMGQASKTSFGEMQPKKMGASPVKTVGGSEAFKPDAASSMAFPNDYDGNGDGGL